MQKYIVLLRGVMPTGTNKVPMAQLREQLSKAGLQNVKTYIQSGNVIAESKLKAAEIEVLVQDVIRKRFGGDLTIIAKTPQQLRTILKVNPFPEDDTSRLYYTLLAAKPKAESLKSFLALDFAPDEIKVVAQVIYSLYATKVSDSKYNNNFFERKLKVAATTRNYNTMTKLLELATS